MGVGAIGSQFLHLSSPDLSDPPPTDKQWTPNYSRHGCGGSL